MTILLCFHNFYFCANGVLQLANPLEGDHITFEEYARDLNGIQTMTVLFRNIAPPITNSRALAKIRGEKFWFLLLAAQGKLKYMNEPMATYRVHPGGIWSGATKVTQAKMALENIEAMSLQFCSDPVIKNILMHNYCKTSFKYLDTFDKKRELSDAFKVFCASFVNGLQVFNLSFSYYYCCQFIKFLRAGVNRKCRRRFENGFFAAPKSRSQQMETIEEDTYKESDGSGLILLFGHFTTIGDLEVLGVVRSWLDELELPYNISAFQPEYQSKLPNSVDWRKSPSKRYSVVVFICGPMVDPDYLPGFFSRFSHCSIYGVNLSIGHWLGGFSPFKKLWPRDDGVKTSPDLSLLYQEKKVPVVGVCLIHPQTEYAGRQEHALVGRLIDEFIAANDFAVIRLDTEAIGSRNICGLGSINSITSLLSVCDVVITSRLHGMVLSLKQGVPVLAIDSVRGGAKVLAQAKVLGWPHVVTADQMDIKWIETHFQECLMNDARRLARKCSEQGANSVACIKHEFIEVIKSDSALCQERV